MISKLNVLVAYPYMGKSVINGLIHHQDKINFLLDSGAFSAWKSGKTVTLDDYCRFLTSLPITPWKYFTLDVVGDPKKTMENYREMLKRGFKPMPVFTPSAPFEHIEEYFETADLLGCGGLTEKYGKKGLVYLKNVFAYAKGRPIHLLGYTTPSYIKHFRPFSCDSSSWQRASRYGLLDIYVGNGEYIQITRRTSIEMPKPEILEAIRKLGFNSSEISKEKNWRGGSCLPLAIGSRSWVKLMLDVEKNIKTKVFLALGDMHKLKLAIDQWDYWNANST